MSLLTMEVSLSALPYLIINLGGEMLYILDQRLRAQSVITEKANRVREDLATKLVEESFLKGLFEPQKLYSMDECKSTFQDIVHSSIMKLNPASMGKLFELMLMGVKMQTLCAKYPDELLHITLNHIDTMITLVNGSDIEVPLRSRLLNLVTEHYSRYKPYQFAQLRRTVLDFFIEKNVRVSLFLSENLQFEDGTFYIDIGGEMPPGTDEIPRTINKFSPTGRVIVKSCENPLEAPGLNISTVRDRIRDRRTLLGTNMYAESKPLIRSDTAVAENPSMFNRTNSRNFSVSEEESKKATNWELDILADFTGVNLGSQSNVSALHLNDLNVEEGGESEPAAKARVSSRVATLRAQFDGLGVCEEPADEANEADFFS